MYGTISKANTIATMGIKIPTISCATLWRLSFNDDVIIGISIAYKMAKKGLTLCHKIAIGPEKAQV